LLVIILQDHTHHWAIVEQDHAGGELIWARSSMRALKALHYTLVWHRGNLSQINDIVWKEYGGYSNIHMVIAEAGHVKDCGKEELCHYSKVKNPLGAPLWKFLSFHFFPDPSHPLGGGWVLSPEPYHWLGTKNQYLGYSIEEECMETPYLDPKSRYGSRTKFMAMRKASKPGYFYKIGSRLLSRTEASYIEDEDIVQSPVEASRRTAWILAKRLSYLQAQPGSPRSTKDYPWHQEQFDAAYEQLNIRFELGASNDTNVGSSVPDWIGDPAKYENHNVIHASSFHQALSTNSIVIGVGKPPM
jgi:hypothetical protein